MITKIKILFIVLIALLFFQKTYAESKISIVYKINQEIITSEDILDEENYLLSLNKQLKNLNQKKRLELAQQSILREIIKKIEVKKYFVLDQADPLLEKIIEDFIIKLKLKDKEAFEIYLKDFGITMDNLKKKIEIETTWNQLIFKKYQRQVNIDKIKLGEKIKKQSNKKTTFLLSEIIFKTNTGEKLEEKSDQIYKSIKEIGFQNTANVYSLSDTSKFGGKIGWVEKQNLSNIVQIYLESIEIGSHTKPIPITNGHLILMLEDIKKEDVEINFKEELNKMIKFETDKQLNTFSKIYFDKIKINTIINEL
jgi:peptidyl-prolyl cis-trans isomerase SurA